MYDRKNYVGKYTDEELKKLEQLCQSYKNNWSAIGLVLGRSASSVKDRARLLKCNRKTGIVTIFYDTFLILQLYN